MSEEDSRKKAEEETERKAEEEAAKNSDNGESDISREAEQLTNAAREIKEANAEKKALLEKEEKLITRREALNSIGGDIKREIKKEEDPKIKAKKYASEVMKGNLKNE